jgi:soluble lytic murein transglycosylase-like protein
VAALTAFLVAAGVVAQPILPADPVARWQPYIGEAAADYRLPEAWIRDVMRVESGGRTTLRGAPITSLKGAMGLMQLMPDTWALLHAKGGFGDDPYDARANIRAGVAYLRMMYERFGYPGLFGAYNAGPARYAHHLATGSALPRETVRYLGALTASSDAVKPILLQSVASPPQPTLFVQTATRHYSSLFAVVAGAGGDVP